MTTASDAVRSLANWAAGYWGSYRSWPYELSNLAAWCASPAGQTAGAPDVVPMGGGVAAATPEDQERFDAMTVDYTAWVIDELQHPPGWHNDSSHYPHLVKGFDPDELDTWATTWCAAN